MPLNFPQVEDIHLAKAPLREVICQVRFPVILRIANEEPVELQEKIRARFPVLEVEHGVLVEMEGLKPKGQVGLAPPSYHFHNQDRTCSVTLAPDFYALSSKAYKHWSGFSDDLDFISRAAHAEYAFPYATRIGLRYINVLEPKKIGLESFNDVLSALRDELTVMLKTDAIQSPELALQRIQAVTNGDRFTFLYGLLHEGMPLEPKFMLDFDMYAEGNLMLEDLLDRCRRYHEFIYSAFRWCIPDDKLYLFDPQK